MSSRILLYAALIVLFVIIALITNYGFLENVIIPDPCYYHNTNSQTTVLFDLFYHFPGQEGGHPAPTGGNYIVTVFIGAFIGWAFARLIINRKVK